jgi:hypothetical protein
MVRKSVLGRGVLVLAAISLVAGALIISPVGAAAPLTKAKVKKIAKKVANKVVTQRSVEFLGNTAVVTQKRTFPASMDTQGDRITVNCPSGLQATGGGADSPALFTGAGGQIMIILESKPVVSGTTSTGWEVEVLVGTDTSSLEVTAHAVCSP